jgi:ATP-dependent protease Clp ATPase subunit
LFASGVGQSTIRKLVKFHGADLVLTDAAVKEIARIALERGVGARGLRAVVVEVTERILFDVKPVTCLAPIALGEQQDRFPLGAWPFASPTISSAS